MRRVVVVGLMVSVAACGGSNGGDTSTSNTTGLGFGTLGGAGAGTTGAGATTGGSTANASGTGATTTAVGATGTTGGGYPAAHQSLPLAVNLGGPVMATPQLAVLAFQDDTNLSSLESYFTALTTEPSYLAELSQYGVTSISLDPIQPQTAPVPASLTDAEVRSDLRAFLAANPSITDATLANTLFVLAVPTSTTFSLTEGTTTVDLCTSLGGYHSFLLTSDGTPVVYAVAAECNLPAPYPTSPLDAATVFLSHEIAEAITDPQFYDLDPSDNASMKPAYVLTNDLSWFLVLSQGELGDLCGFPFSYFRDGAGFLEQHIWSNQAAQAGDDPCGNTPYIGVAPAANLLEPITISGLSSPEPINGLSIPVGSSMTIPLVFFSTGPHEAWDVAAYDDAHFHGDPAETSLSLSTSTGQNGTTAMLTITVTQPGDLDGHAGLEGVIIYSSTAGEGGSVWPILIQSN